MSETKPLTVVDRFLWNGREMLAAGHQLNDIARQQFALAVKAGATVREAAAYDNTEDDKGAERWVRVCVMEWIACPDCGCEARQTGERGHRDVAVSMVSGQEKWQTWEAAAGFVSACDQCQIEKLREMR